MGSIQLIPLTINQSIFELLSDSKYSTSVPLTMTFLNTLRKKSRSSSKVDRPVSRPERSPSTGGSNQLPNSKSSTTVNTSIGSFTPPLVSPIADQKSGTTTRRPNITNSTSSRYSVSGMAGLGSPDMGGGLSISPYAPRIHNVKDGACVSYSRYTFLLYLS